MDYDAIETNLPTSGLIGKYMELTSVGQICPRYRFFVLMAVLGAVVNRKIYIQRGSKETFPALFLNPWVLLIGPQGKGNKSSTVRIGKNIMNALPKELHPSILSAKITPEAFVKALSTSTTAEASVSKELLHVVRRKAIGTLISTEFGVLLGREKYLTGMAILLTDLYDCPSEWTSETIMRKDEKLYDVCISIIAASTPDWMQRLLPKDAFEIGFMSRLVLVPLPKNWRVRKIPVQSDKILFDEVVDEVAEVARLQGEMILSLEAWEAYKEWYLNLPELPPGPQAEYLERKQDHVLRLAGLLQLAQTKELVLKAEFYELAIKLFDAIEPEVMELISYISMEPRMRIVKKILDKIEFEGEVLEHNLVADVMSLLARPSEFDDAVQFLIKAKKIQWNMSEKGVTYSTVKKEER